MSGPASFPSRKRTRLKDYDYSQSGHYFVTICTNERDELFWNDKNQINDAGEMAHKWLFELENKFGLYIDCWTIMPNHVHSVVVLENNKPSTGDHIGSPLHEDNSNKTSKNPPVGAALCGGPNGNPSLSRVMDWFKTMTTNAYIRGVKTNNWKRFNGALWQRSFYDHIIRTDRTLDNIRIYFNKPGEVGNGCGKQEEQH